MVSAVMALSARARAEIEDRSLVILVVPFSKCRGSLLSLNPEVGGLVSGHGFRRAANRARSEGFSPCLFMRVRRTCALGLPSQGLKPSRMHRFGTAEAAP